VLANKEGPEDVMLLPKDALFLFSKNENKAMRLSEIVGRLKSQTKLGELAKVVAFGWDGKVSRRVPLDRRYVH